MPPSNIATAADYADAMMIARRAKNALFLVLLLMLLLQVVTFFVARTTNYVLPAPADTSLAGSAHADHRAHRHDAGDDLRRDSDHAARATLAGQVLRY